MKNGPLLGEAEQAEESRPSESVASAGDLLVAMRQGSPTSLADSENGLLTVLGSAEESRPSCLGVTQFVILGSAVHSLVASANLLTRLTWGFPVLGRTRPSQCAVPLPPSIIGPLLTESGLGVWPGGPLRSWSTNHPMGSTASAT